MTESVQKGTEHVIFSAISTVSKLCLGDISSGRAFDNGCTCFHSCQGVVNDLRGKLTECICDVSGFLVVCTKIIIIFTLDG